MTAIGHCVYLARCEMFVKIGITARVQTRMRCLSTSSPWPVTLVAQIEAHGGADAKEIERRLHDRFFGLRVRGEWFREEGELSDLTAAVARTNDPRANRRIAGRWLGYEPPQDPLLKTINRLRALGKAALREERHHDGSKGAT